MFRIPWKHAAKHDFRCDEDAAIFKAWAEFKGKLSENEPAGPASWKTRLRCALNKSPEFSEVTERSQLDISEPYKVYRLVPLDEQGSDITLHLDDPGVNMVESDGVIDEIHLNLTLETVPPPAHVKECASFLIRVYYLGLEVLKREVISDDVRIAYFPPSPAPPSINSAIFPRVPLPPPPAELTPSQISVITNLLPFMEEGVVLTKLSRGVYAKQLEQFSHEGKQPETEITLCFGEELVEDDDVSKKLIVIKIGLPWAEKQKEMQAWSESISLLQSLAQQSPSGEITLSLVELPEQTLLRP
ncbi:Interferon regulatory factor 8 [Bagarius yarrelli]|uniref:Interferon regulatory factor 8 n=1 Tax=Bagarius yarrelli TaxID=175774 RepID=A0A556VVQ1_BAGYA|nr:Interferon regulatory factor 8 [Bagarius yarrelli]